MRNFFHYLSFLLITCSSTLSAQTPSQSQDLINLGTRAVSKFTGRVEKEVPICSINEFGFNINVGLHYSSEGFKPSKKESEVGHNWFLNAGGSITRRVNGVEDELRDDRHTTDGYSEDETFKIDGYYTGIQKYSPTRSEIATSSLVNVTEDNYYIGALEDSYEISPDEFQFNFGGVSGKFYIDIDGSVKVIPNGPYLLKVDISNLSTQRAEPGFFDDRKPNDSQIVVTLDNGYKYYFGGNYNYLEWHWDIQGIQTSSNDNLNNIYRPLNRRTIIDSWNLSRIIAPNGNEVVFEYNEYNFDYRYYDIGQPQPQKNDESIVIGQQRDGILKGFFFPRYNQTECKITYPLKQIDIIKKSNLKSIKINNMIDLNFQYTNINNPLTDRPGHTLNKINISGTGIPNKEISFEYNFYNKRPFLKKIKTNNEEPYIFEYQLTNDLPNYNTNDIDRNGYYHIGKYSKLNKFGFGYRYNEEYGINTTPEGSPLPGPKRLDRTCFYCYDDSNNIITCSDPINQNLANKGLLKKITLPTKGTINFIYDTKWYNPSISGADPLRVTKILYDDNKGNTLTKSYAEVDHDSPYTFDLYNFLSVKRKNDLLNVNRIKQHKIIQEKLSNGSYIYSIYKNINQNVIESTGTGTFNVNSIPHNSFEYNPPAFNIVGTNQTTTEKLIAEFSFDAQGKPLTKSEFFYNIESDKENYVYSEYIPAIGIVNDWGRRYDIYLKPLYLSEKRKYTYDINTLKQYGNTDITIAGDTTDLKLQSVEKYIFDTRYNKLKEKISYNDNNLIQKVRYTYPNDYSKSNPLIKKMIEDHVLPQMSQTNILENKGTNYALNINASEFIVHNNVIVPFKNYQWSPNPNKESLTLAGTQLSLNSLGQVNVLEPENTMITTYSHFSNTGLPSEIRSNRNTSSYTFYTSLDRKPFLVISNITHSELTTIPASTNAIERLHGLNIPIANIVEALENIKDDQLQLEEVNHLINQLTKDYPNARCSYTNYYQGNGLVKFTMDSRKQKIFYEYDENNFLTITKDNEGNIINHTLYNTKK